MSPVVAVEAAVVAVVAAEVVVGVGHSSSVRNLAGFHSDHTCHDRTHSVRMTQNRYWTDLKRSSQKKKRIPVSISSHCPSALYNFQNMIIGDHR